MSAPTGPRFSVLTAVVDAPADQLRRCLASVRAQTFVDWEHVVVTGDSTSPVVADALAEAAAADGRLRVVGLDGLAATTGELVGFLGPVDVLAPDALARMDVVLRDSGGADVAYSDHDGIDADGFYVEPAFKPDFSPERLRAHNYIVGFLVAQRSTVQAAAVDIGDEHDRVLRLTERASRVVHVAEILYHVRLQPSGVDGGARAIADHCARVGIDAIVEATVHDGCYRVVRGLGDRPLVSVVIPTRGTSGRVWGVNRCYVVDAVRSIVERSTYRRLEFVVVHDTETPPSALDALGRIPGAAMTLVPYRAPFNFSAKTNLGVSQASGDLLLLLNDDTELIAPDSLEVLVGHLQTPDVAMAGAKLLFPDGTLQHGGMVLTGEPKHACIGWRGGSPGPLPLRPLAVERECIGVTAACALVHRAAFDDVGGFTTELPLNYNDVDFCLKLHASGRRIVWTPWAVWYHFESRTRVSRVLPEELDWLDRRWHTELNDDPYYNANLTPGRDDFLERPRSRPMRLREPA